jgi:ribosomal protein S18 acetylase RimI-like enzyme
MSPVLRPALLSDADDISSVYLASRRVFLPFAPLVHSEREICGWVAEILLFQTQVLVALESSRVVGFVSVLQKPEAGWIEQLYLLPNCTGRGLGTQLLRAGLALLGRPVRLYTFQENHSARRFYERHGFELVACSDGSENEERCPDALYELRAET